MVGETTAKPEALNGVEVSLFDQIDPEKTYFHAGGTVQDCIAELTVYRTSFEAANAAADPESLRESLRLIDRLLVLTGLIEHSVEPALAVTNERTGTAGLITRPQQ